MRHSACRRALLDGELHPDVASHLDTCERCRAFSRDLAQVGEYARTMEPGPPPEGLADRVMASVHAAAAQTDDDRPAEIADLDLEAEAARDRGARRFRRAPMLASASVAAAMLLLVGVLAAISGGPGEGPQLAAPVDVDPLLTAAGRTVESGTARIRLTGSVEATITPPTDFLPPSVTFPAAAAFEPPPFEAPPPPDFSDAPAEQQESMRRDYERQVAEMRTQYETFVADARAQAERLAGDAQSAFTSLDIPDEFSFEMAIDGEGSVAFPSRMRVDGAMTVVDSRPPLPGSASMPFAVAAERDSTLVRDGDDRWTEIPGAGGPLGPLLADPDGVADLLGGAEGPVSDRGVTQLGGFAVRHYRFQVDAGLFTPAGTGGSAGADVWIGEDDGIVHKLTMTSQVDHRDPSGFRSRMKSTVTMELFDFGADVTVDIPRADGTSSSGFGPGALLTPYDTGMPAGFYYGFEHSSTAPSFQLQPPAIGAPPTPSGSSPPL